MCVTFSFNFYPVAVVTWEAPPSIKYPTTKQILLKHLKKYLMNSMENMHTDIRVKRVKSRKIRIHGADTLVMPNKDLVAVLPLCIIILSLYFLALLLNGSMKSRNLAERRSRWGPHEGPSAGVIYLTHFGGDHQRAIISKHQGQLVQNELEIFQ